MNRKPTINIIQKVLLEESMFSVEIFKTIYTWHTELNADGITVYFTIPGSRKKYNKSVTPVSYKEMEKFFAELYQFVRTADACADIVDDVARKVTIIYEQDSHRETFDGGVFKGQEELTAKIISFIENQGVKNYWDMNGYEYLFEEMLGLEDSTDS